ncbi:MAG: ABC transporter permease [Bacteriovoracaceae bacterium]|nr:ABC transporter permease [Bacteriovoracaceae bacterium]
MKFNFRRFLAVFKARNIEFFRDKGALGWVFVFPMLVTFGFSYLFNLGDSGIYKAATIGDSLAPKSELIQWITYSDIEEAKNKLRHHQVDLLVDFTSKPLTYYMNSTSPNSRIAEKVFLESRSPISISGITKIAIDGREIKYIDWLFPGLLTMNVLWMALWGVGWVVVRHRKLGVLKRFKASPLTPLEYLLAQVCSRLFLLVSSGVMIFIGGHLIHPFVTEGSYLTLLLIYTLGCLSLSSIGLVVAARLTSEEFANGILNLITYPMMFLSEIWFSLEGSSETTQLLAKFMPLWHMTSSFRRVMSEGATVSDIAPSLYILLGITVVFTLLGAAMFKWNKD